MKLERRPIAFEDPRGLIMDVLEGVSVEHVAYFTTMAGSKRGNHYHKESTAFIFILHGRFKIRYRTGDTPVMTSIAEAGDLVTIEPMEVHSLEALENSIFLMMTQGPKGGRQYLDDTVRETV